MTPTPEFDDALESLDLQLFEPIRSQTSSRDKQTLLTVQRAVRRGKGDYVYLEIGSHFGGSLQPHLRDRRCRRIYSIDKRPASQPDDRGETALYPENATERMLDLLRPLAPDQMEKIRCFDSDVFGIDPGEIAEPPDLCFIDGEHTFRAVLADFEFCRKVGSEDVTVCFHDVRAVAPAIRKIKRSLRTEGERFDGAPLGGSIYALGLGKAPALGDPAVREMFRNEKWSFFRYGMHRGYKRRVLTPLRALGRPLSRRLRLRGE